MSSVDWPIPKPRTILETSQSYYSVSSSSIPKPLPRTKLSSVSTASINDPLSTNNCNYLVKSLLRHEEPICSAVVQLRATSEQTHSERRPLRRQDRCGSVKTCGRNENEHESADRQNKREGWENEVVESKEEEKAIDEQLSISSVVQQHIREAENKLAAAKERVNYAQRKKLRADSMPVAVGRQKERTAKWQRDANNKTRPVSAFLPDTRAFTSSPEDANRSIYENAGRQISPEESISVQVEDITTEPRPAPNLTEPLILETCDKMNRSQQAASIWAVPAEYANSPIAKELAESFEERPDPPTAQIYDTACGVLSENRNSRPRSKYSIAGGRDTEKEGSCRDERTVTLLEQIVRSHTIWYLPHIGRPTAMHLLRKMEPGNFIVRSSSKPQCMAISVKLPEGSEIDTDNYIIEKVNGGGAVRLEGSQQIFRSLPLLLEHYCHHGEELQTHLRLPSAILACKTTKALQSIALMEQDFWTSEMSLSRAASRTSESSTSFIGGGETSDRTAVINSRRRSSDRAKSMQKHNFYAVNEANGNSSSKKRDRPPARFATIHGDLTGVTMQQQQQEQYLSSTDSGCEKDGHSPPLRHRAEGEAIRTERRSQSVRSHKSAHANASPSNFSISSGISSGGEGTKPAPRRSFLKNLLFGHSKATSQSQLVSSSSNKTGLSGFETATESRKIKNSRSAFDVANDERTPSSSAGPSKGDPWSGGNCKLKSDGVNAKDAPSMRTFKPIAGYDDVLATARVRPLPMRRERSDLCPSSAFRLARHTERSPEPIVAGGSPQLTTNLPNRNYSMRQPMRPPLNADDPQNINKCMEELRRKRLQSPNDLLLPRRESASAMKSSTSSKPLTATIASTAAIAAASQAECNNNDKKADSDIPQVALRQRSTQYASWRGSTRAEHRLSVPNLAPEMPLAAERQTAKAIREKLGRNGDGELSTINEGLITPVIRRKQLNAPSAEAVSPPPSNATSMVNSTGTGALPMGGTVARNREALEALFVHHQQDDQNHLFSGLVPKFPNDSRPAQLMQPIHKRFLSERNSRTTSDSVTQPLPQAYPSAVPLLSQPKESELVWRRAKNQPSLAAKTHNAIGGASSHQRGSLYIPSPLSPKLGQSSVWNAVNSELKSRQQKIAKVRPTLQPRSNSSRPSLNAAKMPIDAAQGETAIMQPGASGNSAREHRRSSDYAQLSDFATVEIGISTARQSNRSRDDDAVSVAGTVFEEPWDSSAWENLLDLATHGDDAHAIREPIQEEDSDSDRTAGDSTRMHESEDEEESLEGGVWNVTKRTLPSDRVTHKAWERDEKQNNGTATLERSSKYSTLDSRMDDSFNGSLRRQNNGRASPPYSINSLPRPLSRFSQHQVGSIDDLPTALPSLSPLLKGEKPHSIEPIGRSIQLYVEQLANLTEGPSACFGMTLRQFITCTKETKETEAQAVYRNVRQFMNGMKNYLVKHGEGKLHDIIEEESARLSANQFLNIDAVLESVLHKLLIKEVKSLLYYVLVNSMARTGELKKLSYGLNAVRNIELSKYGFSNQQNLVVPTATVMDQVKQCLRKMQHHYSPIKKLENLLKVIGLVLCCQKDINYETTVSGTRIPSRNDLVRWLVYIFTRTQTMCAELEAYYMWELLPQQIYMQDSFYYLHALYTAISILKSDKLHVLDENGRPGFASIDFNVQWHNPSSLSGVQDVFITVAIPCELSGCIRYATMPGIPHMNTARLCRVIAHQHGITNPEDHGLYLIVDGYESCLQPTDCPHIIRDRFNKEGRPHLFAFKRHEAKIAWPRQAILPSN